MADHGFKHDERFDKLESLSSYKLEHHEQDIRGRPLVTPTGEKLGIIDDLLVDKSHRRVAAVRLKDGRAAGVENLEIKPNEVVWHARGTGVAEGTAAGYHGDTSHDTEVVPVVEEQVAIGKREVIGGTIRVTSHVETERVGEDVRLRDEHVDVERRPVNERVRGKDADALFENKTVEVTERDEEAVVAKEAVVKEEVVVKKGVDERIEHVEETVRRTDVDVERDDKRRR